MVYRASYGQFTNSATDGGGGKKIRKSHDNLQRNLRTPYRPCRAYISANIIFNTYEMSYKSFRITVHLQKCEVLLQITLFQYGTKSP